MIKLLQLADIASESSPAPSGGAGITMDLPTIANVVLSFEAASYLGLKSLSPLVKCLVGGRILTIRLLLVILSLDDLRFVAT